MTIDVACLLDWPAALDALVAALLGQQELGETYVLIPTRDGRPVPSLAVRLITTALPTDDIDEWRPQLAEAHSSELADAFSDAQAALQSLSGIFELPSDQQAHAEVQEAAEHALDDFERARSGILGFPTDVVTEELTALLESLADQVEQESRGAYRGITFAAQVAGGLLQGGGGAVFDSVVGARYVALEWEIDPLKAAGILDP